MQPVILIVIGDPNGIGPEIAVKAACMMGAEEPRPVLVGDAHVVEHYAKRHGEGRAVRLVEPDALPAAGNTIDLIAVEALAPKDFAPGHCGPPSGAATVAYVETALKAKLAAGAAAIVACPHNETAINGAGIPFSGYPGLVARLSGLGEDQVFLMLIGGGLRMVHVTLHERLQDALQRIDEKLVVAAARAAHQALGGLGIDSPRIGLGGINPHAGENGLFGDDDERITVPAGEALRREGIDIVGPQGVDLLLQARGCDAYVVMYHDQGHIPVKLLAGRNASALSIGPGIAFATVGHGSAPDIAGQGVADPEALIRAIRLVGGRLVGGRLAGGAA
jgi:4-hydroxythreonine-4-phosphate dehydrogenase